MDINVLPCDAPIEDFEPAGEQRFAMQDQGAVLRECLVQHYEALRRSLANRVGCEDLATECLHEAWLRLESAAPTEPLRDPAAYVYRVAYHFAVDRLRVDGPGRYADDLDVLDSVVDPAPRPDEIVQARSDARELERALQQLPYRHGCVLFALRVEEKTRQEVADWLSVSVRNVDTMLRQTYETLGHWRGSRSERAMLACLAREAGKENTWRAARNR